MQKGNDKRETETEAVKSVSSHDRSFLIFFGSSKISGLGVLHWFVGQDKRSYCLPRFDYEVLYTAFCWRETDNSMSSKHQL